MVRRRSQIAWMVAACAALVAQTAPRAWCLTCDLSCCDARADQCGGAGPESSVEPAVGCPACAAHAADGDKPSTAPCHCQLTARQDQPFSPSKGNFRGLDAGDASVAPAVLAPLAPSVLGISREYVAASLAMPIRPLRILFGVWRN